MKEERAIMSAWGRTAASLAALAMVSVPAALAGGAAPVTVIFHTPRIALRGNHKGPKSGGPAFGWSSSNWSGYAITTGAPYTSVTGNWIVPAVSPSRGPTYSASWVGIDGFNNSDLIQTGTEQDYAQGGAQYAAWWEILPAAETVINEPVQPGDHMSASIVNDGGGEWTITLSDTTEGWTFSTKQAYSGPGASAEWIQEAPTVGGHIATLANYGETTFNPGTANGGNPGLVTSDGGVMIQKGKQVSTPSVPDSDTDGFNIQYGSVSPSAPAS